jgi:hypothetical protein
VLLYVRELERLRQGKERKREGRIEERRREEKRRGYGN